MSVFIFSVEAHVVLYSTTLAIHGFERTPPLGLCNRDGTNYKMVLNPGSEFTVLLKAERLNDTCLSGHVCSNAQRNISRFAAKMQQGGHVPGWSPCTAVLILQLYK